MLHKSILPLLQHSPSRKVANALTMLKYKMGNKTAHKSKCMASYQEVVKKRKISLYV